MIMLECLIMILVYFCGLALTYAFDMVLIWLEYSDKDFKEFMLSNEYDEYKMDTLELLFWFIYIWLLIGGLVTYFLRRNK